MPTEIRTRTRRHKQRYSARTVALNPPRVRHRYLQSGDYFLFVFFMLYQTLYNTNLILLEIITPKAFGHASAK